MKKLISLLLILACALGLSGCASKAERWQEQYDLGIRFLDEGNYSEAIIAFEAAISIDDKNPLGYLGRGNARALSSDEEDLLRQAYADFEKVLELDPTNEDAWLGKANVAIQGGDLQKAEEILREALEILGSSEALQDKLDQILSGNIFDTLGRNRCTSVFDPQGNLLYRHMYFYYPEFNGGALMVVYDSTDTEVERFQNVCDEDGRPLIWVSWVSDGRFSGQSHYEYDDENHITISYDYSLDGKTYYGKSVIQTNEDDTYRKIEDYDEKDELRSSSSMETSELDDPARRVIVQNFYNLETGEVFSSDISTYYLDENGNTYRQELEHAGRDGVRELYRYLLMTYDGDTLVRSEEYDAQGNLIEIFTH